MVSYRPLDAESVGEGSETVLSEIKLPAIRWTIVSFNPNVDAPNVSIIYFIERYHANLTAATNTILMTISLILAVAHACASCSVLDRNLMRPFSVEKSTTICASQKGFWNERL
jgi:hypothetical protein